MESEKKKIQVVAALIEKDGLVLFSRRAAGKNLEGLWEFPGGKVEPGESPEQALVRELQEELGVNSQVDKFLLDSTFEYPTFIAELAVYAVRVDSEEFSLGDHDQHLWCPIEQAPLPLIPGDVEIVERISAGDFLRKKVA